MRSNPIRQDTIEDISKLESLIRAAFSSENEVRLVQLLRNRGELLISLVTLIDDTIIGYVAASPVTLNDHSCSIVGIAPLAVLPSHQKRGIGASLMNDVIEKSRDQGFSVAVLLGDPSYYPHFGFKPASNFQLDNEYGATAAFMAMELQPNALENASGAIRYSSAFVECGA